MEKRVVLFLVLSLAIILGYDYLLRQLGISPAPSSSEQVQEPERPIVPPVPESKKGAPPGLERTESPPSRRAEIAGSSPRTVAAEDRLEEVNTDLFHAVFSSRGAAIKSWELKRYTNQTPEGTQPVQLVYAQGRFKGPLTVEGSDSELNQLAADGLYRIDRDFERLDALHPVGHLTFIYEQPQRGLRVEKQLTIRHDSYLVDVAIRTTGLPGPLQVNLGTNFGIVEWGDGFIGLIGPAVMVGNTIEKDVPDQGEAERKGDVHWVALQDKYFLSVLIPRSGSAERAAVVKKEADKLVSASLRLSRGNQTDVSWQLFAGPKQYDTLKSLNLGLEDTIDFGWFIYGSWSIVKAVAKPLFYVLRFLSEYTHNYGLSIILLTMAIKLLFVPLQYKSYKSMKDMQLIQPKVAALQTKYKDDRERLNRELIRLYRDHKVNPVGGCLPMLLQMPVFVALFNILYMTIDLRQAPFILWVRDLSAPDPYYVLPVLMGISMVLQQKIMPTTMDPTQAKIMLLLPAFMTVLFLTFPSGLVLYWLTNNVITILQQFVTDRYIIKKPTVPAAESLESSGSGTPSEPPGDGQKSLGKKKKDRAGQKPDPDRKEVVDSKPDT
jgi:YidC/Oxa1 family membrane protein insertase